MAEEQEKQKPKTTLIKHRKEDQHPADDGDRKKVRVVVRRKPKGGAQKHENEDSGTSSTVKVRKAEPVPPSVRETGKRTHTESQDAVKPSATETVRIKVDSPNPPSRDSAATRPNPFTVSDYKEPPPSVRESVRTGRGTGQPGAARNSRPGTAPSARRPQRPGGPRTGARPAGAPQFRGPRTGPPPSGDEKKPTGKRFYKSKKREYPRRERNQEREIQFKQKKSTPRANPIPKQIDIMEVITVSELAKKMNLKASDLIGKLMGMGMMVTINQQIDADTATLLADEYGCQVNIVSLYEETLIETEEDRQEDLSARPPVVTIMGHVDHGKTKLLDTIRSANVVEAEFGGITQHIGAYQVHLDQGEVTFLDTPGHEAFTLMRARGAQVTDIVVLVVAADDGVMPQTREAIDHARAAKVPIIVAINKIDLPDANAERVKQQLSDLDLMPEAWGGNTLFVEVSALKGTGIKELLEALLLQAEILELQANRNVAAEGTIIESKIDPGRGTVCTVLIQRGTLKVGDSFVAGVYPGKVRTMFNDRGETVTEAAPAMPVEILGFTGVPQAGDPFQVTESDKVARQVGDKRQELRKVEEARNVKKITLDNLYDSIQEGEIDELRAIIKGDVHGSVEAIQASLEKLSTSEIRLTALRAAAGAINEDDVRLAAASDAIIIGFHVRPTPGAQTLAEKEKVEIRKYNIIYDVVDDIRDAMEGMLTPDQHEKTVGRVEVRDTFKVPKIGVIAGCYVTEGVVRRNANVNLIRDGVQIYTGKVGSLKRFKDDAREVEAGFECGLGIEGYSDIKVGDEIEVFEIEQVAKTLGE
jgi:translation initiation factor IF-2